MKDPITPKQFNELYEEFRKGYDTGWVHGFLVGAGTGLVLAFILSLFFR